MPAIALYGSGPTVRLRAARYARLSDVTVPAVVTAEGAVDARPDVPPTGAEDGDVSIDTGVADGMQTSATGTRDDGLGDAHHYDDLADALASQAVDGVDVSIPDADDAVLAAVDAGVPVLALPPIAEDSERLAPIADRIGTTNSWLGNGALHRSSRFYERFQDRLSTGAVGQLGVVRITRTIPCPRWGWNAWYVTPGDALVGAAYDLDFLRWVGGDVERVFARQSTGDSFEHLHVLVQFTGGAKGHLEVTRDVPAATDRAAGEEPDLPEPSLRVEASGDRGRIWLTQDDVAPVTTAGDETVDPDVPGDDCYARTCRAFASALDRTEPPAAETEAVLATTRAVVAARQSLAERRPVSPGDRP